MKDRNNTAIKKKDGGWCFKAVKKVNFLNVCVIGNNIWVSLKHVNGFKTFFNFKYIEQGSSLEVHKNHFDNLSEIHMSSNPNTFFIMTGDYN